MRISLRAESECIHDILDIWWEQRVGEALGEISFHKTRLEKSSFTDFQKIMIRSSERYTFTKNTHKHWKSKIPPCIILCCIKSKFYFLALCVHCTYKVHHKSSHWGDLPTTMPGLTTPRGKWCRRKQINISRCTHRVSWNISRVWRPGPGYL